MNHVFANLVRFLEISKSFLDISSYLDVIIVIASKCLYEETIKKLVLKQILTFNHFGTGFLIIENFIVSKLYFVICLHCLH